MKLTSLVAMLTLLAVLAATLAVAGCGGKSTSGSTSTSTSTGSAQALHQTGLLSRARPGSSRRRPAVRASRR